MLDMMDMMYPTDGYEMMPTPPAGYHYETMSEIQNNWAPGSYTIMPYEEAMYSGQLYNQRRGGKGKAAGNKKKNKDNDDDDDDGDGGDDTDGDEGGDDEKRRRKRGYFSLSFPFMHSSQSSTDGTVENPTKDDAAAGTAVVDARAHEEVASAPAGNNANSVPDTTTPAVNGTDSAVVTPTAETAQNNGTVSGGWSMTSVVGIASNLESSLVIASPYLPIVYKVAVFIVPGLSSYQVLLLTVNVATITTEALRNYARGDSWVKITTTAASEAMTDALVRIYIYTCICICAHSQA